MGFVFVSVRNSLDFLGNPDRATKNHSPLRCKILQVANLGPTWIMGCNWQEQRGISGHPGARVSLATDQAAGVT